MVVLTSVARETMKRCFTYMRGVVWWRACFISPRRRNDLFSLLTADFQDPFPPHEPTYFLRQSFSLPLIFFLYGVSPYLFLYFIRHLLAFMLVVCHLIYDWQTGGERSFFSSKTCENMWKHVTFFWKCKIIHEDSVNSCISRTRVHSFFF